MRIVDVPASLDARSIDELFREVAEPSESSSLLDARHLRWIDPTGMLSLLAAGRVLAERQEGPVRLHLPESADVVGYLARMGFFAEAPAIFELTAAPPARRTARTSDVLLEITPIRQNEDVHAVVDRVQKRAGTILARTLGYPPSAVVQFAVILSEVCQNILEHAEAPGWVAAQVYKWTRRLGREVLALSVVDVGRGFRGSLASEHSARFADRWGDATALEAAFIHGLTRFPDSGRGQGIQQIRRQVRKWDGIIAVRSGTARIADVPAWDDTPPLEHDLPSFPGAQISIVLPAAVTGD
ncbi:MAG: hypothetical protein R3E98_06175 [Gemmatimonadota bacterium]|nr:hypothetical protein [Gemmatimonadota bacterium]